MKHVFIIGSKGIPAKYGGFETFVEKLTQGRLDEEIQYHVACLADDSREFGHNGAHCFDIRTPDIGPAKAVLYDMAAFRYCNRYIKKHGIHDAIIYVLACRIGPFIRHHKKRLKRLGGTLYLNPDGHEWKRAKWNQLIRRYWKLSEKLMIRHADLIICDSQNIESYIHADYGRYHPKTMYIAYGAETGKSAMNLDSNQWKAWSNRHSVKPKEYFLVVGRFVPENNYETMIREFMASSTDKDFVLITDVQGSYFKELRDKTGFHRDARIKFVGTVYDQELLKKIREEAFAYIHGHEVGGTNPSLLEALASTDLNLLLDVGFNREVAEESALYWNKSKGDLCRTIEESVKMTEGERASLAQFSTRRIEEFFSWRKIIQEYENTFKYGKRRNEVLGINAVEI